MKQRARLAIPSFSEQFLPKLVTVLREGYGRRAFRADLIAGLYDGAPSVYTETEVSYEDGRKGVLKATLELRDARVFDTGAAQMAAE